ncbi:MAG TPA: tripartite tricarboxylate transporter substrate binding protein [Burkholderiales bacterium]|nr:tripartite tricarboxylate transporter substrate binding protein [Burkholderiales bacterium]
MRPKLVAIAGVVALGALQPCAAQTYPVKPIRLIVPSSPGGGTDIVGRALAQKLTELLGQQVVVENRAGAGTMIGNEIAAKSAPDGYTLLMGLSTLAILPAVHKTMRYDALKDLVPISQAVSVPNVLVVHPSLPVRSVKDLIALAKSRPREIVGGSAGVGTNPHLSLELFKSMAGIEVVHVPYKGSGPGIIGLISGEVALLIPTLPTAMSHIKAKRVRPLGVSTSVRAESLPQVPTIAEAALPGYEATQWFGVLAPAGTPRAVVDRLHKEIVAGLRSADLKQHLANEGAVIVASSPEQFAKYLRGETDKWARVVKAAGIKQE